MPKKRIDRFDLEAEAEGNAIKKSNYIKARGKRIMRIRRGFDSGNQKIQTRIEKRYVS